MINKFLRMKPLLNISRREQMFLMLGGCFVLVFLIFLLLVEPVFQKREQLGNKITEKRQDLVEMKVMRRELQQLRSRSEKAEQLFSQRQEDFTLFSFMDRLAGQTGIKDNISYMKPGSSRDESSDLKTASVELKIEDVTLEQLISYLYKVETSKSMVRIERLSVSGSGEGESLLSVVMHAKTYET
ncbi:MAG: type II secretion system protein GspM [Desulfobacterales bacterium]